MAIHKIQVKELTPENFAPYGTIIDWPANAEEMYTIRTDRFDFIPGLCTLNSDAGNMLVGISHHYLRPYRMQHMERHYHSEELMIPFHNPIILAFAKHKSLDPSEEPEIEAIEAFKVNLNQGVVVKTGIWHWTPFAVGGDSLVVCIFADGTGDNDCDIRQFPEGELVQLCF